MSDKKSNAKLVKDIASATTNIGKNTTAWLYGKISPKVQDAKLKARLFEDEKFCAELEKIIKVARAMRAASE